MKTSFYKGFTLIELLVVIAIIGIITSIVLASVTLAREKASDSAIKSDLNNMRAEAGIYYDNNNQTYGVSSFAQAVCPGLNLGGTNMFENNSKINQIIAHATLQTGVNSCVGVGTPITAWAVAVNLKTAGKSWCVDSFGQSEEFSGDATLAFDPVTGKCN